MNIATDISSHDAQRQLFETRFGIQIASRKEYIEDFKTALTTNVPYAVGALGISEKYWMYYPLLLEEYPIKTKLRVFERHLIFHGLSQEGIFPAQPGFYVRYNDFFLENVRHMDWLGLVLEPVMDPKLVHAYQLGNRLVCYLDLIPDKSIPNDPENDYVQYFEGKKILIICPFGELLKARATKEIFEGVWAKTGKKWFYPAAIDALEFPYGFDRETHKQYATAIDLFEHITAEVANRDFDIALIAAAGLAIPIASFVKSMGKIGIDLGAELQFLFGIKGTRWRDKDRWKKDYFTGWWTDAPDTYRPNQKDVVGSGAFW
jgi:hypothetical protein